MRSLSVFASLAASLGLFSAAVHAADPPIRDNQIRIGAYYVYFIPNADDITGPGIPPGEHLNIGVKSLVTPYFAYVRRLSTHFEAELAAGWPPVTKTVGRGPPTVGSVPYNNQVIATARWFSPSFLVNYKFFGDDHALRPYIGVGVNYTRFFSRQSTAAGNAISGGPTKISLPASVGVTGTAGISYRITDRFNINASYDAAVVRSRLTADTAGFLRTSEINFGVRTVVLSFGFLF